MINQIKIAASFASKDKSSILSNVIIKDGFMTAQNGLIGISLCVDSDVDFCCNADKLRLMLNNCKSDVKLSIKKGKIYISSGKFKSSVDLVDVDSYPMPDTDYDHHATQADILDQMAIISRFSDPNDVRVALQGVAISGDKLYATNGHMAVVKNIHDTGLDESIIPSKAINLIAKTGLSINNIGVKNKTIIFGSDDGYLFSKTIDHKMPDINRILCDIENETDLSDLSEDLKAIAPLCGDSRYVILSDTIANIPGDASFDGYDFKQCAFNVDYLLSIISVADIMDFSLYPNPCPFEGDDLKGAIVGIKL